MTRMLMLLALCAGVVAGAVGTASTAAAQTLRWASQGDAQTMDPHSQNESLTNGMNSQVYERLTARDRQLNIVPGLATEWTQVGPLVWRFKLRPNVKFHDGSAFTADDVVFSLQRAKAPSSQIAVYANAIGTARKIDELTVEITQPRFNPIFLQHLDLLFIMSKSWCEQHKVTRPLSFKDNEESFASFNANGTGPYLLTSRQPGIRTVYKRNPNWWGRFEGNVQEVQFTPISNDATRLAALVSGEVDLLLDPSPRDVPRLRATPGVQVIDGLENRLIFVGMDQARDTLVYGRAPGGRNPFQDLRVRRAMYQAIDIDAIHKRLMNGLSQPTGGLTPSPLGAYGDPALETRLPFDLAAARKGMADAGYADGFEVTLDCPNNRYINDERICLALASMWAQINVKVKVNAMPRVLYFPKLERYETSLYLMGWGGAITDAETILTPVYRSEDRASGAGYYNYGRSKDPKFDQLAAASSSEADPVKREQLIKAALQEYREQLHVLPLHRQASPWATRQGVKAVHRADNWLDYAWVTLPK